MRPSYPVKIRALLLVAIAASATCDSLVVEAQTGQGGVIMPLTAETREQAIACGRRGGECSVTPYQLCPADGRYDAHLATPFSRVASAVTDAKARRPMTSDSATQWGVGIYVYPPANLAKADPIQRLEIRRDGRTIQPITSTVGPLSVKDSDGSTRQSTRGFFTFPADVFAPTFDVTVVFVGSAGETNCVLDAARLRTLR